MENSEEAVILESSVESFETLGYVRNVEVNASGYGIVAEKGLVATSGGDENLGLRMINRGAIYAEGQSDDNVFSEGMSLYSEIEATNGSTIHTANEMANEGSIYAKATGDTESWPIGMYSEISGTASDGNLSSMNFLTNTGNVYVQTAGNRTLSDATYALTDLNATNGDASAMNGVMNVGTLYAQTNGISRANAWTDAIASDAFAITTGGGNAVAANFILNRGTLYAEEHEEQALAYGTYTSIKALAQGGGKASAMDMERNTGSIYAEASGVNARAIGIYSEIEATTDNGGNITVTTMLQNDDVIHAVAEGDFAVAGGIFSGIRTNASGEGNTTIESSITNSGTIYVSASGELAAAMGISALTAIDASDTDNATARVVIINTGKIKTETTGALTRSYGIAVAGDSTIVNTGCMCVNGAGSAGIMIMQGDAQILNPGSIHATDGARALHIASSATAEIGEDFQLIFSGNPTDNSYAEPILLDNGASLNLNSATLLASTEDTITWDAPYSIIENNGGTVEGSFDGLRLGVANPSVNVAWSGTDKGENAAVTFTYTPKESTAAVAPVATQQAVAGTIGMVQNRMSSITLASLVNPDTETTEILLADSGTIVSDAGYCTDKTGQDPVQAVFIKPYLTTTNMPSDDGMGYDASTTGFIAGYDFIASPELMIGVHGGFAKGDIDYTGTGYSDNSDDLDIYSLGLHGTYSLGNWHVQASTSGYAARHDYEGLTGINLDMDEDDTYMTYGTETALTTGYGFRFGKMALMPEIGMTHSWIHGESHTTDADNAAWNTHYGSYDEHVFKSVLGARFLGTWELGGAMVTPALGVHWEEALSDNTITVSQSLPGTSSVSVSEDVSDSSIVGDASLRFAKDNASMELGIVHEYNDDYTATGGSITFRWAF